MSDPNFNETEINTIYKIHRDFAEHENILVNHRMTWFSSIQSFLLATFGFSFQKYFEIAEKVSDNQEKLDKIMPYIWSFKILFFVFAFVGLITSYATKQSVKAALDSIELVGSNWDDKFKHKTNYSQNLPSIIGLKQADTLLRGHSLSLFLPRIFFYLWIIVSLLIIFLPPSTIIKTVSSFISNHV